MKIHFQPVDYGYLHTFVTRRGPFTFGIQQHRRVGRYADRPRRRPKTLASVRKLLRAASLRSTQPRGRLTIIRRRR